MSRFSGMPRGFPTRPMQGYGGARPTHPQIPPPVGGATTPRVMSQWRGARPTAPAPASRPGAPDQFGSWDKLGNYLPGGATAPARQPFDPGHVFGVDPNMLNTGTVPDPVANSLESMPTIQKGLPSQYPWAPGQGFSWGWF